MTVDLQNIKKLYVGDKELKALYKGDDLIWKGASAWGRKIDLYPRSVKSDEDGNLYVLASSKVQSTGSPTQLKMFKLNEDGDILFSVDLKKMNANISYSQMGFIVAGDYIYIPIYNYLFQIDKKDGTLVEKVILKDNGFTHVEQVESNIVLMNHGDDMSTEAESLSIPNLVMKKYASIPYDVADSKVNKNGLYILSNDYQALFYVDKDFSTKRNLDDIPGTPRAFEIDDTYFYVCNGSNLIKYNRVTKKPIWQISVSGSSTGSLFIVNNRIILESNKGFFIYENTKGELVFSKPKASALPSFSNKLLANIDDKYFCRLAYDEKAVYKLELGDEDNYENLN